MKHLLGFLARLRRAARRRVSRPQGSAPAAVAPRPGVVPPAVPAGMPGWLRRIVNPVAGVALGLVAGAVIGAAVFTAQTGNFTIEVTNDDATIPITAMGNGATANTGINQGKFVFSNRPLFRWNR